MNRHPEHLTSMDQPKPTPLPWRLLVCSETDSEELNKTLRSLIEDETGAHVGLMASPRHAERAIRAVNTLASVEAELRETAGELEQARALLERVAAWFDPLATEAPSEFELRAWLSRAPAPAAREPLTERIAAAYGAGQSAAEVTLAAVREHVDRLSKLRRMRSWDRGEVYAASQVDDIASELHTLLAKGGEP